MFQSKPSSTSTSNEVLSVETDPNAEPSSLPAGAGLSFRVTPKMRQEARQVFSWDVYDEGLFRNMSKEDIADRLEDLAYMTDPLGMAQQKKPKLVLQKPVSTSERLFFRTGHLYILGGAYGLARGAMQAMRQNTSDLPTFRLKVNSFLNTSAKMGGSTASRMGIIGFLYSAFEYGLDHSHELFQKELVEDLHISTPLAGMAAAVAYSHSAILRRPLMAVPIGVAGMALASAYGFLLHSRPVNDYYKLK